MSVETVQGTVTDLVNDIEQSEAGRLLAGQLRWEDYKAADVTAEAWKTEVLDCDADNLQHLFLTATLAELIADIDGVDEKTRTRVVKAALVHDLAEAYVGDTRYDLKNDDHEHEERKLLPDILADFDSLDKAEIADIIEIMRDSKAKPPETEAGGLFELAERLGYMRTGLIAWRKYLAEVKRLARHPLADFLSQSDPEVGLEVGSQANRLFWLAGNVLTNHIARLVQLAREGRPSARQFLADNRAEITQIFHQTVSPRGLNLIETLYNVAGQDERQRGRDHIDARIVWDKFTMRLAS